MRSQVSIETIFLISMVIIIFILTTLFTFNKRAQIEETGNFIEKRNECSKIATAINYLKINGPGSKARIKSRYLITTIGNRLQVQDIVNETLIKNNIAILASPPGTTTQEFYDEATLRFDPDWYSNCNETRAILSAFPRCTDTTPDFDPTTGKTNVNFLLIPWRMNYTALMKNITHYNTIYLEDAHTIRNNTYKINGKFFTEILDEWVRNGGTLILSEHFMCKQGDLGCTPDAINPTTFNNILGVNWQFDISGTGSQKWNTFIVSDLLFPLAPAGTEIKLEEYESAVADNPSNNDALDFTKIATRNAGSPIGSQGFTNPNGIATVAHWRLGTGTIIYLSDFEATNSGNKLQEIVINLVQNAFTWLYQVRQSSEVICHSELKIDKTYVVTGNIELENVNKTIVIKNYE